MMLQGPGLASHGVVQSDPVSLIPIQHIICEFKTNSHI